MGTTDPGPDGRGKWLRRFGWLLAIWMASVVSLYLAALLLRFLMNAVGLSR
ncbi:DUF2474 domain-containing protein [Variovorax paradoxus]|nr:DUF2474 domain-containing protein [Variovorax paradoxus]